MYIIFYAIFNKSVISFPVYGLFLAVLVANVNAVVYYRHMICTGSRAAIILVILVSLQIEVGRHDE